MELSTTSGMAVTVKARKRQDRVSWWLLYGIVLLVTLVIGAIAVSTVSTPFSLALVVMLLGAVVAMVRPVAGLYLVALFAMMGDTVASGWYPFTWNFSTRESILYINDGLIVSPLDLYVAALVAGWLLQMTATRNWHLVRGRLFWPVMTFSGFLLFGFVYGLARGGNSNAAMWEFRPFLYMPLLYLLVTNLFTRREQYRRLLWFVMVAVSVNAILAIFYYNSLSPSEFDGMESLVQHAATVPMDAMFILIAAAFIFKRSSPTLRRLLPVLAAPVVFIYVISQRRAAIVALFAGLVLVFAVLNWVNRRMFWRIAPVAVILVTCYVGAFWSSQSSAGFPAQAVKSVIAPGGVSERNQGSDQYRVIENHDILYTIKSSPLLGIGFGQKFLRPLPLPAISIFLLEDYKPHNSILSIWMKAGIGGFVAMLFLFGSALRAGTRAIIDNPRDGYSAFTLASVAFVLMYAVFAYVDMAWDAQTMVLLGLAFAQIDSVRLLRPVASGPESSPARELVSSPA
jgi:O-antigen ligase